MLNALAALSAPGLDYGRPARPLPVQRRPGNVLRVPVSSALRQQQDHQRRPPRASTWAAVAGWSDGYVKNGVTYNARGQVTVRNTELPGAITDAP